ncbi:NUDIX domain-containing protein [Acinetobacter defluvii]|uniref:NUDIX domain-containing protein n=1 Tax=Acinetobacter defluvii TaxID=1871111 RepID=A0A2S2FFM0_9GAMM|nr:NUDIX domain-containing protein [Acinetobacter defluvii]AWL29773.1 NUDIX domain-containing protein [Acinetobacter defluvii]
MGFHDFYRMSSHAVICNAQKQILMLKANYADCAWGLPGGGLDVGETIHEALIRECHEEIGCDVQVEYLSGVYFHASVNSHAFIFKCSLLENAKIQLSDEHSAYRWLSLDELSTVQKIRIEDCLSFHGTVQSRAF